MTNQTKLLITGATGFTGIHACHHFQQAGYEVIGVSRKPFTLEGSQMQIEPCDLTNKNEIMDLIKSTIQTESSIWQGKTMYPHPGQIQSLL